MIYLAGIIVALFALTVVDWIAERIRARRRAGR